MIRKVALRPAVGVGQSCGRGGWPRGQLLGTRNLLVGVVFVVMALVVVSVSAANPTAKPVLRIGTGALTEQYEGYWTDDERTTNLVNEPILFQTTDGTFVGGLATSWRYVPAPAGSGKANKSFEFTLRTNARFSDGTRVTARVVAQSLNYLNKNDPYFKSILPHLQSVSTVGKWSVRIDLQAPNPDIPDALANSGSIIAMEPRCMANPKLFTTSPCGSGAYRVDFSRSVVGDHKTLVPNPFFYDKSKQYWREVDVKLISNPSSMLQAIQAGQLDVATGDPTTAGAAARSGLRVVSAPSSTNVFDFDVLGKQVPALKDVRVRQALNYAIDRNAIAKSLGAGYAQPTSEIRTKDGFDPSVAQYYKYDPAKAKALLAAAGYPNGFTVDNMVTNGTAGTFGTPVGQAVAKYLSAVGVNVTINPADTLSAYYQVFLTAPMSQVALGVATTSGYIGIYPLFHISDPLINNLWYHKAARVANPAPYKKAISNRVVKQAYFLPVVTTDLIFFVNKKKVNTGPLASAARPDSRPTEWSTP
jgi:peptide/nickel transport system substrate-binding protein